MLELKNASKIYPGVKALDGVSVRLPDKGLVAVLGKSGSGKSTLLNVLAGVDTKTEGELYCNGNLIDESNIDEYRREYVSFIYQDYQLISGLSIFENVALVREVMGDSASREEVLEVLSRVGLGDKIDAKPHELSGGEQQRVSIARAVIKPEAAIFADEPTGNLDSENGDAVFKLLKEISKERLVAVVTHDRDDASRYADYIIEISDGKIVSDNTAAESVEKPLPLKKTVKGLRVKTLFKMSKWSAGKKRSRRGFITLAMAILVAVNVVCYALFTFTEEKAMMRSFRANNKNSIMAFNLSGQTAEFDTDVLAQWKAESGADFFPLSTIGEITDVSGRYFNAADGSLKTSFGNFWKLKYGLFCDNPAELDIKFLAGDAPDADDEAAVPRIFADNIVSNGFMQTADDVLYVADAKTANADDLNRIVNISDYSDIIGKPLRIERRTFKISGIFEDNSVCPDSARCMPIAQREAGGSSKVVLNDFLKYLAAEASVTDKTIIFSDGALTNVLRLSNNGRAVVGNSYFDVASIKTSDSMLPPQYKNTALAADEILISESSLHTIEKNTGTLYKTGDRITFKPGSGSDVFITGNFKIAGIIDDSEITEQPELSILYHTVSIYGILIHNEIVFADEVYNGMFAGDDKFESFVYNAKKQPDKFYSAMIKRLSAYGVENGYSGWERLDLGERRFGLISDTSQGFDSRSGDILDIQKYLAIPLFVVSVVLLFMFVSLLCTMNFEAKESDTGILKALGTRKKDIYAIFMIQSLISAAIQFIIGSLAGGVAIIVINLLLAATVNPYYRALSYGADNFFVVLAVICVTATAALAFKITRLLKKSAMQIMRK